MVLSRSGLSVASPIEADGLGSNATPADALRSGALLKPGITGPAACSGAGARAHSSALARPASRRLDSQEVDISVDLASAGRSAIFPKGDSGQARAENTLGKRSFLRCCDAALLDCAQAMARGAPGSVHERRKGAAGRKQ